MPGLSFTWELRHKGWAFCSVGDDSGTVEAVASDITDGPEQLLRAVAQIVGSSTQARAEFEAEPTVFRWFFQRNDSDVEIRLVKATDYRVPADEGLLLWSSRQRVSDLARAVINAFDQVRQQIGYDGYIRQWGREFPEGELEDLRGKLLKSYPGSLSTSNGWTRTVIQLRGWRRSSWSKRSASSKRQYQYRGRV